MGISTTNADLFRAILAMDAYNRGYNAGIKSPGAAADQGLLGSQLGLATIGICLGGDKVWLLDVIAPTKHLALLVLAKLRQVLPSGGLSVHPVAAAQVEPAILKAMRKADEAGAA